MGSVRVGTVDLPARAGWDRYFGTLTYLELSGLFAAPVKTATMSRWRAAAPPRSLGLVAPWPITHRKPPAGPRGWTSDAWSGDFRDGPAAREALAALAASAIRLEAAAVIFQSPADLSTSAATREHLTQFFTELAPASAFGGATRVWIPGGLWEPAAALAMAEKLEVVCAVDPFVTDPEHPLPPLPSATYLRPTGLGRTGVLSADRLDELSQLIAGADSAMVAFATGERLKDALNLAKLVGGEAGPGS
jgi:uncharacterized protein YecE (DUF72 family)